MLDDHRLDVFAAAFAGVINLDDLIPRHGLTEPCSGFAHGVGDVLDLALHGERFAFVEELGVLLAELLVGVLKFLCGRDVGVGSEDSPLR